MKLEDQVASLDLAKKLKELGVKQESLFYWDQGIICDSSFKVIPEGCSAFTVAELGEMLPKAHTTISLGDGDQSHWRWCSYGDHTLAGGANTEADARAKMLIYLLENKLISA